MSNNGYTIRAELLSLSVEILESRLNTRAANEGRKPKAERRPVEPYSVEDVIEYAEVLNDFVSSRR